MYTHFDYEIRKIVARYAIYRQYAPPDMVIDVSENNDTSSCRFSADCNYSFYPKRNAGPYSLSKTGDSEKEAVEAVLRSLDTQWTNGLQPRDIGWVPRNNSSILRLGTGDIIHYSDFKR
jgi:hypothetical protein